MTRFFRQTRAKKSKEKKYRDQLAGIIIIYEMVSTEKKKKRPEPLIIYE